MHYYLLIKLFFGIKTYLAKLYEDVIQKKYLSESTRSEGHEGSLVVNPEGDEP
jgi:hypothetical protein